MKAFHPLWEPHHAAILEDGVISMGASPRQIAQWRCRALSRQIGIGYFWCRIRPGASVIPEQKQWSSAPPRGASRQYRIYSDNGVGLTVAQRHGLSAAFRRHC